MNWRAVWALARKDILVVSRSRPVMIPLVVLPLLLLVLFPILISVAAWLGGDLAVDGDLNRALESLPPALAAQLADLAPAQQLVIYTLSYVMAPLFLIVPLIVASVIAADSFAGEKERKTLEALLYSPTSDTELLVGKMLPSWLLALAVSLGGFVVYSLVANVSAWPLLGRVFLPNGTWVLLAFWVAPAVAGLGLGVTVLVSARVRGFQEATQLSGAVVLPLVLLIIAQVTGLMVLSTGLVALLGLGLWLIDLLLVWLGARIFSRSRLIQRL